NLDAQAKPVWDEIDERSGGAMSRAKDKYNSAAGDQDQYREGKQEEQDLLDKYRQPLMDEKGLDVDNANQQYRRARQVEKMQTAFERSINPDTGELSGKQLSREIGKLEAKGEKSAFVRGDFTQDHIDALREVADIMKTQEK